MGRLNVARCRVRLNGASVPLYKTLKSRFNAERSEGYIESCRGYRVCKGYAGGTGVVPPYIYKTYTFLGILEY